MVIKRAAVTLYGLLLATVRALGLMICIAVAVFFLIRAIPGDVVDLKAYQGALDAHEQAELRQELGLDQPVTVQFYKWFKKMAVGDLGISLRYVRPVKDMILHAVPITLKLASFSLAIGLAIGIGVATAAAVRPGSIFEWLVNGINIWSIAFPTFSVGVAAILVFVIWLGWTNHMGNIWLPSLILGIDVAGQIVKPLHEDLKECMESSFIRTARAKGLTPLRIVFFHALPNSLTVALALGGIILAGLVNGSITMEVLFGLPGMSSLALSSIQGRDYTVVQAVILYLALSVVVANFITDILQRILDPRLKR